MADNSRRMRRRLVGGACVLFVGWPAAVSVGHKATSLCDNRHYIDKRPQCNAAADLRTRLRKSVFDFYDDHPTFDGFR
jgi:hypothetical protein